MKKIASMNKNEILNTLQKVARVQSALLNKLSESQTDSVSQQKKLAALRTHERESDPRHMPTVGGVYDAALEDNEVVNMSDFVNADLDISPDDLDALGYDVDADGVVTKRSESEARPW